MNLRTLTLGISALALSSLIACGTAPGQCSTNADCTTGVCDTGSGFCVATCGNTVCTADQTCSNSVCIAKTCASPCTTGQTCELLDGGYDCVQTDCFPACDSSYQECNKQAPSRPVCVATTCHPACAADEQCSNADGGFTCVPVTVGYINIESPDGGLSGIVTPLSVTAIAGAPGGGPTLVELTVQQDNHTPHVAIAVGNQGTYSGNINLADAGLRTGTAVVTGTVYWLADGGEADAGSTPVTIQIDADPPSFGAATTGKDFYSGTASPAQTAQVTVPINDVGLAGVDPSRVTLSANGHTYPADSTAFPDGGNGSYSFAVPVSALNASANFLGPVGYVVAATDKVGNASMFDGGSIAIDNIPPSFDTISYDAGTWFGGDAGIAIAVNVQDQASGSRLNPGSVTLALAGGQTLTGPAASGIDTYTFNTTGAALRASGQGPVLFGFTAEDNAGNIGVIDGGAILVDELAPTVGATSIGNGTAHASSNGWFAQDGGTIQLSTIINDGNGSGPASATLTVGARAPVTSTVGTVVSNGTSYAFTVPTSAQAVGSETPMSLSISGADAVGNSGTAAFATDGSGNAVTLNIDGKAPVIGAPAWAPLTNPNGTDASGVQWFSQIGGTIDFTATITDSGSLVNVSSVALQTLDGTPVGITITPGSGSPASNVYTFFIPRGSNLTGLVPAGSQGLVNLQIVAKDNVGNTATLAVPQFGIDGQPPTVSFSSVLTAGKLTATTAPAYPTTGSGCASGATGVDYCGHDAAGHFWRKNETNKLTFYGNDGANGSGVTPITGSATCNIATSGGCTSLAYVSTDPNATANFQTIPDFSKATFTSAADGTGTINVTVTVTDLAENVGTATVAIAVTRVKWARKPSGGLISLAGSPIVTSTPAAEIIFGGTNSGSNPIASYGPDGTALWQAGHTQGITTISSNMAYSPATKLLYIVPNSGPSAYVFPLTGSGGVAGVGSGIACTGGGVSEAPTIISSAGSEYALIPDDSGSFHRLAAFLVSGSSCAAADYMKTGSWAGRVYTASSDGTTVYAGHDDTGLAKATFANGSFGAVTEAAAFTSDVTGNVALTTNLYLGDANATARYRAYNPTTLLPLATWPTTNGGGATNSSSIQPPIVSTSYVFGSFDAAHDGHLRAFDPTTGAADFSYPTDATKIGTISAVGLGSDNQIYFSDSSNKEFVALKVSNSTPTVAWKFTGTPGAGAFAISSVTTEPTLDSSGTAYFGDSAGDVFALITDSAGPLAPTAGTNWPRVGFDNCNSGNTSFSCQ